MARKTPLRPIPQRQYDILRKNLEAPEFEGFPIEGLAPDTSAPQSRKKINRGKIIRRDDDVTKNINNVRETSQYDTEPLEDLSEEIEDVSDSIQNIQEPVLKASNIRDNELTESDWDSIRSATKHLKFKYNIFSQFKNFLSCHLYIINLMIN